MPLTNRLSSGGRPLVLVRAEGVAGRASPVQRGSERQSCGGEYRMFPEMLPVRGSHEPEIVSIRRGKHAARHRDV